MIVNKESHIPNSFSIPSVASFVVRIKSEKEIPKANALAKKEGLPLITIGSGSNIIPQDYVKAVILILNSKGIELKNNNLKIQAGEKWDEAVRISVKNGLSGIEALSGIPGNAGAAPIQNIGAYGSEISNCLESVYVYDKTSEEFHTLSAEKCKFEYRNSLFKKNPEKFIIVSINLNLSKEKPKIPKYKDIENFFLSRNNGSPSPKEIREAILETRKSKLPDPYIYPNSGSYFINPILENNKASDIKDKFPEIPLFPFKDKLKIPAGWLIEKTGLKGSKIGKLEIYYKNALVLINPQCANFKEAMKAENFIIQKVFEKFGITLKREPVII